MGKKLTDERIIPVKLTSQAREWLEKNFDGFKLTWQLDSEGPCREKTGNEILSELAKALHRQNEIMGECLRLFRSIPEVKCILQGLMYTDSAPSFVIIYDGPSEGKFLKKITSEEVKMIKHYGVHFEECNLKGRSLGVFLSGRKHEEIIYASKE